MVVSTDACLYELILQAIQALSVYPLLPHNLNADNSDDEIDVATDTTPLLSNCYPGGSVAEMILAKKVTWKQIYYQVAVLCLIKCL